MIRYTTPTYELTIEGVDLTGMQVFVTFSQHGDVVTIENPAMAVDQGDTTITCTMTQAESAKFRTGEMDVQVNWVDASHNRCATLVKRVPVDAQLLQEEK